MSEGVIRITGNSHEYKTGVTWANNKLPPRDDEADRRIRAALLANKLAEVVTLGEGLPESDFDYGCVPPENRTEVHKLTNNLKGAVGRHIAVVVEIGDGLRMAKGLVGHGNFLPWLKAEFRLSERSARSYMAIAAFFQGKSANFADLDLTTARELFAAPAEVRDEIFERAEAGEIISKASVRAKLAEAEASSVSPKAPVPAEDEARLVEALGSNRNEAAPEPNKTPSPTFWQFAEPPTGEQPASKAWTSADLQAVAEKSAATEIVRDLGNIAYQCGSQNADKLVERLSAAERDEVRRGVEAVMGIKAALDKLDRRVGR